MNETNKHSHFLFSSPAGFYQNKTEQNFMTTACLSPSKTKIEIKNLLSKFRTEFINTVFLQKKIQSNVN